jgi:hypothetical protein
MKRDYRCTDVTVNCERCGKAFHPFQQNRDTARFCSRSCKGGAGNHADRLRSKSITLNCQTCGKAFHPHYTNKEAKYCSSICSGRPKAPTALKMSATEVAWLAGLFDGEGSIVFPRNSNVLNSVRLTIANTNRELLETVQQRTGTGQLIVAMCSKRKNWKPHYKPSWHWQCYGENTRSLLSQMLPWLIEKRDKALIVLSG